MALSIFDDKSKIPQKDELAITLGRAIKQWDSLKSHLANVYEPLTETWIYSGKAWGWALRLKQKKRAVVYLTPCKGYFHAGLSLGEKAANAAHKSDLPVSVMNIIDVAKKYAEGRAIRMEIRNAKTVSAIIKLISIKMAN
ncbi:MAG: DUF3788 domain-containing protein [Candidatus Zixiibacteriota bacterium]